MAASSWVAASITASTTIQTSLPAAKKSRQISTSLILNSATTALSFSNSGTSLLTIGAVTGAASSGTVALTINSTPTGVTTLTGANTYTGVTTINVGTLTLNRQTDSLSGTTPLTFGGTGTFNMDNTGAVAHLLRALAHLLSAPGMAR